MSRAPINPTCPLCWKNGLLKGGQVLKETRLFYAYGFFAEAGDLTYALIVPKDHHDTMLTLPWLWGWHFARCYAAVRKALNGAPHNGYWNEGYVAGQRIMGHVHVRVEPRFEGQPASGMGLGLLITSFNEVTAA